MKLSSPRRFAGFLALPIAAALLFSACSSDDESGAGDDSGGEESSGAVNVSGSSTVAPISTRVAELWAESGSTAEVNVDGPGTGDGFVLFCDGETDISDASRPIKEEEADVCKENGIEFIELKVAFDGLSVLTNPANTVECLNFVDLYAIAGPESQGIDTWEDAGRPGRGARLRHDVPRGFARHHRPRRGVGHLRQLHRDRAVRHRRGPPRGGQDHRGPGGDHPSRLPVLR